jgi:hypothetical protein
MATRGRPKKVAIHQVSYYTPKPELAYKAHQKVLEGRLKKAYSKLFTLAYGDKPDQRDMHEINLAVKHGMNLL